jgi:phosphomevalonate kinase
MNDSNKEEENVLFQTYLEKLLENYKLDSEFKNRIENFKKELEEIKLNSQYKIVVPNEDALLEIAVLYGEEAMLTLKDTYTAIGAAANLVTPK